MRSNVMTLALAMTLMCLIKMTLPSTVPLAAAYPSQYSFGASNPPPCCRQDE